MVVFFKIFASFLLVMSMTFVLLPGGFGLMNFKRKHGAVASLVATVFYHGLWLAHAPVVYNLWSGVVGLWWPILLLLLFVVVYFVTVGENLAAG